MWQDSQLYLKSAVTDLIKCPFCQVVFNLGNEEESTPISVSLSEYVELDGFEST